MSGAKLMQIKKGSRLVFLFTLLSIVFAQSSLFAIPKAYMVGSRGDRYGANANLWAMAMLLAKAQGVPLHHDCNNCGLKRRGDVGQFIKGKIFHQILVDFCQPCKLMIRVPYLEMDPKKCTDFLGCNIPTGLKRYGLANKWFKYFDNHAKKRGWKLRWDPKTALVIHVRLEDVAPPGSNSPAGKYYKGFSGKYIGDEKLQILIEYLGERFPDHEMHLVTSPLKRDIARCKRLTKNYPCVKGVWGDWSEDYALWQMMCSDILMLSRSWFSLLAGLLHQGQNCLFYRSDTPVNKYVKRGYPLFDLMNGTGVQATWEALEIPGI